MLTVIQELLEQGLAAKDWAKVAAAHAYLAKAPHLTPSQFRVYTAIKRLIEANGYSPSLDEVAAECGIAKTSIYLHYHKLRALGYIAYTDTKARSVRLLREG